MKTRCSLVLSLFVLVCISLALPNAVRAQDEQYQSDQQDQQDPPSRVAQLNYIQGSVSYQPSGEQDWVQADTNRPLTTGDNLWADQNSRGEVHIGSTALRIGDQTGISFLNLSDQAAQIQLAQGMLYIHVRQVSPEDAYEIDTPNLAFSILRPGDYRLDTDPNGDSTTITVYSGEGTVTGGNQTYDVGSGRRAIFTGTNQLSENVEGLPRPDDFDGWARSREMREERAASLRYVSPDVTGGEELDDYGSWRNDPDYGAYWVPSGVGPDWQPYRDGHWAWVAPWGWTWVDNEPWGFAPFHYGRWAIIGGGWGWVPGPVAVAPVYSPAVVGFVGGGGFGVAVGFGAGVGVGWFPLGPRDVYVPAYRVSPRYVEAINVSNTRIVNRTTVVNVYNNYTVNHVTNVNYTYANNTRAVTVVNRDAFVGGRPVARSAMRVSPAEIERPRVVTTAQLTPSRASVVGVASVARAKPPATIANRRVVTKMTPAPQAAPIGRPRPTSNPNLSPAVVNRSGYSPQLQTVHATAAAREPARAATPAPENRPPNEQPRNPAERNQPAPAQPRPNENPTPTPTRPSQPRPNEQPSKRPFTPPNRPAENPRPNENPSRTPAPPAQPRPNENPNRPFTPPNRPAENPSRTPPPAAQPRPEERPRTVTPPSERQPEQPRPEARPPATPPAERQPSRPAEQPRPETRSPERQPTQPAEQPRPEARPRTSPPPQERPAPRPQEKQPPPKEEKPKEKPHPQPQSPLGL